MSQEVIVMKDPAIRNNRMQCLFAMIGLLSWPSASSSA